MAWRLVKGSRLSLYTFVYCENALAMAWVQSNDRGQPMYIMPFDKRLDAGPPSALTPPTHPFDTLRNSPERVRELILQAADVVFANDGYAGTTVLGIAAQAGLPKSNVLYYFKSKDNLYSRVLERIAVPYLKACAAFRADDEPLEALARHVRAMIRLFRDEPFASKVFMVELREGAPRLSSEHAEQWRAQARVSVGCLAKWIERGLLAPMHPHFLLLSIWSMAQSSVSLGWQMSGIGGLDIRAAIDHEAATETATRLILRGLLPLEQLARASLPAA